MITRSEVLEPKHWGLTAGERADRGRRFAVLACVLCAGAHLSTTVPVGTLWPLAIFTAFIALVVAPLWLVGLVHALGARRRHRSADAQRAVAWWLFPAVAIGATAAVVVDGLPRRVAWHLVASDLAELAEQTRTGPRSVVVLDDRFVGPYPCEDLRRYPNGTVRVEFRGAGLLEGARGLVLIPDGEPIPFGLELTPATDPASPWQPWLERDAR